MVAGLANEKIVIYFPFMESAFLSSSLFLGWCASQRFLFIR